MSIAVAFSAGTNTTAVATTASKYVRTKGSSNGGVEIPPGPLEPSSWRINTNLRNDPSYEAPPVTRYTGSSNVNLDFSPLVGQLEVKDMDRFPFTILCDGCEQFLEITFDSSLPNSASSFKENNDPKYQAISSLKNGTFTIGQRTFLQWQISLRRFLTVLQPQKGCRTIHL